MGETNNVRAAIDAADDFMALRSELVDLLKDSLSYSFDAVDVVGHVACAEAIIAFFAEKLATPEPEGGAE